METSPLGPWVPPSCSGCVRTLSERRRVRPTWWTFAVGLLFVVSGMSGVSRAQSCQSGQTTETTIYTYTPQAGIAGVTRLYISGLCFGATQGTGSVSIGGVQVPSNYILQWSGDEIVLVVPETAQTGIIEVDSQNYGSDTSSNAAANQTNGNYWEWVGNDQVSGTFTVFAPSYPSLPSSKIDPAGPSAPQYVEGTWNMNAWWGQGQYVLSQGTRTSDGSYPLSGSIDWSDGWGDSCSGPIMGSLSASVMGGLSASELLAIKVPDAACGCQGCGWSEEWVVLNSGDATSQGWLDNWFVCDPIPANFPNDGGGDEGSWWCWDAPLLKSGTDTPSTESPSFLGWAALHESPDPTYGAWPRTLPLSGELVEFSGRFVFEQAAPGGGGVDGCYRAAINQFNFDPYDPFTSVTGGGWYVNTDGVWGSGHMPDDSVDLGWSDGIGINSDHVRWYQRNVGQCSIRIYQTMFVDSIDGAVAYNAGGPNASTNQLQINIDSSLGSPVYCTGVIPSGGSLITVCQQYPPQ